MINFRYHVVSLVAVFLALGTGTLVGSSFISRGTVAVLQASLRKLDGSNRNLIGDVRDLKDRNGSLQNFVAASEAWMVRDRLSERAVVIVAVDTTPSETTDALAQTLAAAGARLQGSIQLTSKLDLSSQPRRAQVAEALGALPSDADTLARAVIDGLAAGLSGQGTDVLRRIVDSGLAVIRGLPGSPGARLDGLGEQGSAVVVLGGPPSVRSDVAVRLAAPLAQSLAALPGAPVLVGAAEPGAGPFQVVGRLREADLRLVTIDGVEEPMGRIQVVLGLEAAVAGRYGDYGTGPGASSILPQNPK